MPETPEMVRWVAEAITANNGGEWHLWLDEARAAIEAMRRTTEHMGDVLDRVPGGMGRGAWEGGIDAALASPEAPEAVGQESLRTAPDEGGRW